MSSEEFRARLLTAFPPEPFLESISAHDECDDGIALRSYPPGKRWTDVTAEFVKFNSGSLALLDPLAWMAFLPAWLLRAFEMLPQKRGIHESVASEFTLSFLCPGDPEEAWKEDRAARLVRLFNLDQRSVVCDYLLAVKERYESHWVGEFAEFGLSWWGRGWA